MMVINRPPSILLKIEQYKRPLFVLSTFILLIYPFYFIIFIMQKILFWSDEI